MKETKKCIIVDDEPAAHYVPANYIKQNPQLELVFQGYNGIEAMDYLRENKVDLMFLDINMPVLNGWEFLKKYLEMYPDRTDKIVILSSSIDFQDRQKAEEFPIISGFLEKPLTIDKINGQMEKYSQLR
jgi:response regulator of citrate/malate metabolism